MEGVMSKKDMAVCILFGFFPSEKADEPMPWADTCMLNPMNKKKYKLQRIV